MASEPRIALVALSAGLGGAERRMFALARMLREQQGRDLTLVITREEEQAAARFQAFADLSQVKRRVLWTPFGVDGDCSRRPWPDLLRKPANWLAWGLNWVTLAIQLAFTLDELRPDLVHLVLDLSMLVYWPLSYFRKTPLVVSLVGDEMREFEHYRRMRVRGRIQGQALLRCLKAAAQIDVLGPDLMKALEQADPTLLEKSTLLSSFVETERFTPAADKQIWVVFAHRFIAPKNPLLFVQAIAEVAPSHPQARFFLLGYGPLEDSIREKVRELNLEACVTIQFSDSIEEVLSRSLVFLGLQADENYPSRALLEAMSCGNAVVATDVGFTHLLVTEQTGLRIPPDPAALACAICRMLDDPSRTEEYGRNGRELVIRDFGVERYLTGLQAIYEQALQSKFKPR